MMPARLDERTRLGYVHLTISDIVASLYFYQYVMGFHLIHRDGAHAILGVHETPLLRLTEVSGAKRVPNTTGLYHFAIRVPSRFDLARSLYHLLETEVSVSGGDHDVSEAIYFNDPDGNGIEIYRDRPRDTWQYPNGTLKMGTRQLDFNGILAELGEAVPTWTGLKASTTLGHMHLHVADLAQAEAFYRDVIGFEYILSFGAIASFLAAGGYHHHIGINTWAGVGAPPPPPGSLGLRYFTVHLSGESEQVSLISRLAAANAPHRVEPDVVIVHDPSENEIHFTIG